MDDYKDNPDYTKSELGYEDNTAKPGKDGYNTTGKGENNAHRKTKKAQDGQVEKNDEDGSCGIWKQSDSEGKN